jgi:hypothetical protein
VLRAGGSAVPVAPFAVPGHQKALILSGPIAVRASAVFAVFTALVPYHAVYLFAQPPVALGGSPISQRSSDMETTPASKDNTAESNVWSAHIADSGDPVRAIRL